jgi:hypothetical protein
VLYCAAKDAQWLDSEIVVDEIARWLRFRRTLGIRAATFSNIRNKISIMT